MAIINSLFDNDLYKFTMQRAILGYRQNVPVRYEFINRRLEGRFNQKFMTALQKEINSMASLQAKDDEIDFLRERTPFLGSEYLEYIRNYRFNPNAVRADLLKGGELFLQINGSWENEILWEVPLMSIISELYFYHCDTDWKYDETEIVSKIQNKADLLRGINFTDFGTRRRRSYATQDLVVRNFKALSPEFRGTSNVHLAHKYDVRPIGTMAHEWIMGISALESLVRANYYAMKIWSDVYKGNLGTALPDTFGSEVFWKDFDGYFARLFDGPRHDSGCPYKFTDKALARYKELSINPLTKSIIYTNGLDVRECRAIQEYCANKVQCGFGIGTNLTNDFFRLSDPTMISKALNMVIKMIRCNNKPVVKVSDDPPKAIGDRDAMRVANWTFYDKPLDS